jgi:hypothetical protein
MRWMLLVAGAFVLVAGAQLFVLSERTEDVFAWTIDPPLTAAFLGAGYWSSAVLELGAARRSEWSRARIAMPAVLIFTTLTTILTLIHLDRFHTGSVFGIAWIAVYLCFPVAMSAALALQLRAPGGDRPRTRRLPAWTRLALGLQAGIALVLGLALYVAPLDAAALWPWTLTPLTGRAVGAWLLGIAIIAVHMAWEDDDDRVEIGMLSYAAFAALQLVGLARYPDVPDWSPAGAAAYLAFLAAMLVTGLLGWRRARSARRTGSPA